MGKECSEELTQPHAHVTARARPSLASWSLGLSSRPLVFHSQSLAHWVFQGIFKKPALGADRSEHGAPFLVTTNS